ncbi:uncharacterized protein AB675_4513 [Cyphellophora attinorum]|uniref:Uncharacterized protein n=1 Tax=Cyphellophora attinorum TaxID=1664694 RepID=A0A0N1H2Y0_9EURO|nr:uncharacterized protein AB675_4513 [Phialophora attinorum]KPI39013.1 hypothetical protein AB675_4513 [Phialophora attinorum]
MHAIGTSHNCFSCVTSNEQHTTRHKKIAELLAEYRTLDEAEEIASVKNKKGNHGAVLRERDNNAILRQRDDDRPDDEDENVDNSSVSNASTNTVSTKSSKLSKAEVRAAKREAKSAKSQRKSLKNQNKHLVAVKAADVEHVAVTLHGEQNLDDSHPLASDKSIEDVINRNLGYVKYIKEHKKMLLQEIANTRRADMETRARKARKRKDRESISNATGDPMSQHKYRPVTADEDEEALVNAVLIKFGIQVEPAADGSITPATPVTPKRSSVAGKGCSQEKAMVLAQLRIAIAEDLEKHENEQRQTLNRAGAFWRYVGHPVFKRMMALTEGFDWKTGAKKSTSPSSVGTDQTVAAGEADDHPGAAEIDDVQGWVEDVANEPPV